MQRKKLRILGVMTGTSSDGLDSSCVEFERDGWFPIWHQSVNYPKNLRKKVLDLQKPNTRVTLQEFLELDRDLGEWFAKSIASILQKEKVQPDVIANHGQTVAHFPAHHVTLQIGNPARIAAHTGLTVVSNFREGDMAAGGEGAPLVPRFHQTMGSTLPNAEDGIAIHNIGGISNMTYLHPKGVVLAFDTGPGNCWIDAATFEVTRGKSTFDRFGSLGAEGSADEKAIVKLLKHPYFKKLPPKSTGRDDFPYTQFKSSTHAKGKDLVATATWFTIETIAQAYEKWIIKPGHPLHTIYLSGGGAKNSAIKYGLESRLKGIRIRTVNEYGHQSQTIESHAFALFGFYALIGQPLGGSWTGVKGFGPPAQIMPGRNWSEVLNKLRPFIPELRK